VTEPATFKEQRSGGDEWQRSRPGLRWIALARPLFVCGSAVAVLCGVLGAAGPVATAAASQTRLPVHHSRPKITGPAVVGKTLRVSPGRWSSVHGLSIRWERCNSSGAAHCKVIHIARAGRASHAATGRKYTLTKADVGHRIRVVVRGRNARGATSANSRVTVVIKSSAVSSGSAGGSGSGGGSTTTTTKTTTPAPGTSPNPNLFTLVPSSGDGSAPAGIPRSDAECAAAVTPTGEKRPSNTTDNNSVPSNPSLIPWGSGWHYWPGFIADRDEVTGDFKGTTDEIIQWAACKWGLDLNEARAEAWLESGWYMSTTPGCGGAESTYGIFQIMVEDCAGDVVHGGYPYVADDTALGADYWGAWIRACFDGAFLDPAQLPQNSPAGGYNGQSIASVIAANGEDYALYGCVGAWNTNAWYNAAAQDYINIVKQDEQSQLWLQPNT
jgi:autotransporter family porin